MTLLLSATMLLATVVCAIIAHRIWRSPDSWHIDGKSKEIHFHAWPALGIFACFGIMFLTVGYLTAI